MSRYLHRYGIDPTGKSTSNLVQNEVRTMERRDKRALVPMYGAFYADSLRIRDKATNELLKKDTHYVVGRLYDEPSAEFGKKVYGIIIITDTRVSDTVVLEYQVVGGKYEDSLPVILELINAVRHDDRTLLYSSIEGAPSGLPPVRHLHDIGDIRGFEGLTHAIDRTRMTIELSSVIDYDNYFSYIDRLMLSLADLSSLLATEIIGNHVLDNQAHSQYMLAAKIENYAVIVRKPKALLPANNAINVPRNPAFTLDPYCCMYRNPQKAMQVHVSKRADFSGNLEIDATVSGPFSVYQYANTLEANKGYYWRARYQADDLSVSDWSTPAYFTTGAN